MLRGYLSNLSIHLLHQVTYTHRHLGIIEERVQTEQFNTPAPHTTKIIPDMTILVSGRCHTLLLKYSQRTPKRTRPNSQKIESVASALYLLIFTCVITTSPNQYPWDVFRTRGRRGLLPGSSDDSWGKACPVAASVLHRPMPVFLGCPRSLEKSGSGFSFCLDILLALYFFFFLVGQVFADVADASLMLPVRLCRFPVRRFLWRN